MTSVGKIIAATVAFGLSASTVFAAATAVFTPTTPTSVLAGEDIFATVEIFPDDLPGVDDATMLIGTSAPGAVLSLVFDATWASDFNLANTQSPDAGVLYTSYESSIEINSSSTSPVFGSPLDLGTIKIDTAGIPAGIYEIGISPEVDGFKSELKFIDEDDVLRPLSGSMSFEIIPEPATAFIMLLGGISLLRRVRS